MRAGAGLQKRRAEVAQPLRPAHVLPVKAVGVERVVVAVAGAAVVPRVVGAVAARDVEDGGAAEAEDTPLRDAVVPLLHGLVRPLRNAYAEPLRDTPGPLRAVPDPGVHALAPEGPRLLRSDALDAALRHGFPPAEAALLPQTRADVGPLAAVVEA